MLCSLGKVGPRARQAFLQGHTQSLPACEVPRALQGWGHHPLWGKVRRGGEETCPTEPAQQRPGSDGVKVWGLLPEVAQWVAMRKKGLLQWNPCAYQAQRRGREAGGHSAAR